MTHPIPTAALDDRLAFVGNAGSGKTYAAGTAVERLLDSGAGLGRPRWATTGLMRCNVIGDAQ